MRNSKTWTYIALVVVLLVVAISLYSVSSKKMGSGAPETPTGQDEKYVQASLNQTFTLKKGQVARINYNGTVAEVEIKQFFNSPCPEGARCIWSGLGVSIEIRHDGQSKTGMDVVDSGPFAVRVVKTDYENYANIIVSGMTR